MSMTMRQSSVATFTTQMNAFTLILDKAAAYAEASKFDPAVYMTMRLRPDMLAFPRQVQTFCDIAKNACGRLAAVEPPRFDDNEATLDELKGRIARTLTFLNGVDAAALEAGAEREIVFPAGRDIKAKMLGRDYLAHYALPNFFFHVTTGYDLLRYAGVPIGKRDYFGAVPGFQLV